MDLQTELITEVYWCVVADLRETMWGLQFPPLFRWIFIAENVVFFGHFWNLQSLCSGKDTNLGRNYPLPLKISGSTAVLCCPCELQIVFQCLILSRRWPEIWDLKTRNWSELWNVLQTSESVEQTVRLSDLFTTSSQNVPRSEAFSKT